VERLEIKLAHLEQPVRHLSGGNQQKVVLAKWLDSGADIFLFDEPTAGVDIGSKGEIYALMKGVAREGRGVIFVSSEFVELVETCSRVLIMREGRVVGELVGEDITERKIIERCYHAS